MAGVGICEFVVEMQKNALQLESGLCSHAIPPEPLFKKMMFNLIFSWNSFLLHMQPETTVLTEISVSTM